MSKTNLTLDLRNIDSNAFALIGQAQRTLRHNGMSDLIEEFRTEATSGDYSHLLCTLADWFDLELAGDKWLYECDNGTVPDDIWYTYVENAVKRLYKERAEHICGKHRYEMTIHEARKIVHDHDKPTFRWH